MAEGKIMGYVNLYQCEDGTVETGSGDLYATAQEAAESNAEEFVGEKGSKYLGVATVTLTPAVGQPNE